MLHCAFCISKIYTIFVYIHHTPRHWFLLETKQTFIVKVFGKPPNFVLFKKYRYYVNMGIIGECKFGSWPLLKGTRCLDSVQLVFKKRLEPFVIKCKWLDR